MATQTQETGHITGTKDKDYNIIWLTEQCLSNVLRLETYIAGCGARGRQGARRSSSAARRRRVAKAPSRARRCWPAGSSRRLLSARARRSCAARVAPRAGRRPAAAGSAGSSGRPVSRPAGGSMCLTSASGRSGRSSAAISSTTTLIAPTRRSRRPLREHERLGPHDQAVALVDGRRDDQVDRPSSSSSSMNVTPLAVAGRWRATTRPATSRGCRPECAPARGSTSRAAAGPAAAAPSGARRC